MEIIAYEMKYVKDDIEKSNILCIPFEQKYFQQYMKIYNSNFAHRFCLCTLKIQYLAVIQLSKVCCYAA